MLSDKLKQKLEFYEKYYFSLDDPVPFKDDLYIYPVTVQNYYDFYSCIPCITFDKNVKKEKYMGTNRFGKEEEMIREVSNPEGMKMSNMAYLVSMMREEETGKLITSQIISLLELVLHEKNGLFCPNCGHKRHGSLEEYKNEESIISFSDIYHNTAKMTEEERTQYFADILKCPVCGETRREIFSITGEGQSGKLCIYNNTLTSNDFEELKMVIMHYNILNYDGDEYVDPDLKADLEKRHRLQNKDYTSPSLEKQLVCISISSPYTFEELKSVTLRKLTWLLKMVDTKANYYAQIQGAYSGMVKFKQDPVHWIYGDNGREINKDIMMLDDFKNKFKGAV